MNHGRSSVQKVTRATVLGLIGCLGITACAGDTPKGPPPPTPDQVRGHADRTFDKLKQEEQERGSQANTPR
ncbi:MAG TPA: hypothetical protein VI359_01075 [Nitrospiraceae bacterium]